MSVSAANLCRNYKSPWLEALTSRVLFQVFGHALENGLHGISAAPLGNRFWVEGVLVYGG